MLISKANLCLLCIHNHDHAFTIHHTDPCRTALQLKVLCWQPWFELQVSVNGPLISHPATEVYLQYRKCNLFSSKRKKKKSLQRTLGNGFKSTTWWLKVPSMKYAMYSTKKFFFFFHKCYWCILKTNHPYTVPVPNPHRTKWIFKYRGLQKKLCFFTFYSL